MEKNNLINIENAMSDSPTPNESWIKKSESERIEILNNKLNTNDKYKDFQVLKASSNGHMVLTTDLIINAANRGVFLLELEQFLKDEVDNGLTLWLEAVGDKSKLRALRGIKIND
jgi:hypothetical protein